MTFYDIPLTGRLSRYLLEMVGIAGFEPAISSPPDWRVNLATLYPVYSVAIVTTLSRPIAISVTRQFGA